ncbi:hypothetical protein CVT26_015264 [Gymnopilus dilepis]|uniref:Uncharacterized protein n=1 Tax=Gymnopilus dilepis TaxID=231916 RepID=A0A409W9X0_9AGAR|nr:hypothetical protein CVT26_015264 [Gymnopilus dilepis]
MADTTYVVYLSPGILRYSFMTLFIAFSSFLSFLLYRSDAGVALTVLPVLGYALLAGVLAYLALRVFRYFRGAVASRTTLPKPVSESSHKGFSWGRSTGWDWKWRRWSSLVPRVPVPSWSKSVPEIVKGKAKATASAKNLSVELLPTTAPPPPPTSLPSTPPRTTSTPKLVDLSTPPTPPLTTGATTTSFPTSPRTPSPPFPVAMMQPLSTMSKQEYSSPAAVRSSSPRPPSPHALLATTPPPKQHRRSRSLGGVPIRRVSSWGRSGLRNAVELHDMSPAPAHVRGTSREHLLIDFASSGSSDEDDDRERYGRDEPESAYKISPAASDIGVLPLPPAGKEVDARMVGHHVPLVDLDDGAEGAHVDEDSWKWFASAAPVPSLSFGRGMGSLVGPSIGLKQRPKAAFATAEKLVDIDGDDSVFFPPPGLVPVAGVGATAVVTVHRVEADVIRDSQPPLVDLGKPTSSIKATPLVDLHDDDDLPLSQVLPKIDTRLVDVEDLQEQNLPTLPPAPLPSTTPVLIKASFSHPLQDLVTVVQPEPLLVSADKREDPEAGLLFAGSQTTTEPEPVPQSHLQLPHEDPTQDAISPASTDSEVFEYPGAAPIEPPSPLLIPVSDTDTTSEDPSQSLTSASWGWDDLEDPWGNHVPEVVRVDEVELAGHVDVEEKMEEAVIVDVEASSPDSEVFVYSGKDATDLESAEGEEKEDEEKEGDDLISFYERSPKPLALDVEAADSEFADLENAAQVLDKSPSGSLFATVLPDDGDEGVEAMPPLDLDLDVESALHVAPHEPQQVAEEDEEQDEATPKATPASVKLDLPVLTVDIPAADPPVPVIIVQESLEDFKDEVEAEPVTAFETFPDPDLLPLPDSPLALADAEPIQVVQAQSPSTKEEPSPTEGKTITSQTPTPPASPPPISPLRFNPGSKSRPPSPGALSAKLRLPALSPRLALVVPPPSEDVKEKDENETPTALTASSASSSASKRVWEVDEKLTMSSSGLRKRAVGKVEADALDVGKTLSVNEAEVTNEKRVLEEEHAAIVAPKPVHAQGLKLSSSLPGSFPEISPTTTPAPALSKSTSTSSTSSALSASSSSSTSTTTIAGRLALAPAVLTPRPSARALVRSPLDIALAMQLRPGLGAGADPAWMVRFLMAMFGWLAVVVSGGEQFH